MTHEKLAQDGKMEKTINIDPVTTSFYPWQLVHWMSPILILSKLITQHVGQVHTQPIHIHEIS